MRFGSLLAGVLSAILAGTSWADEPAGVEGPPFAAADTPARAELLRRFEEMDDFRDRLKPPEVIPMYRELHRDSLREYGPDAYEPYAVLDRLATFYNNISQDTETDLVHNLQAPAARREFLRAMRATRREIIEGLARSRVVDWRKRAEIAKHEGLLHLFEGRLDQARPEFDEAAKRLGEHPGAGDYSLARVLLAQAEIAVGQGRWDDAEAACDRLFRLFHRLDARSLDQLSLDVLEHAGEQAAFHLAYSLARRRAHLPGKAAKFAEWNLNTKVHRRDVFARQLAALRASDAGQVARPRDRLHAAWGRLAALVVQPPRTRRDRAMRARVATEVQAKILEAKALAREAARVTAAPAGDADNWVTIDQVRAALPPDAVLIDLVQHLDFNFDAPAGNLAWKGTRDIAFVIPPAGRGEVRLVDIGDGEIVWQVVDAYVRGMATRRAADAEVVRRAADAEVARASRDLSRVLLHPLLPHVRDARRWVISPSALTWLVPWSTLVRDDGALVVEHHATSYVMAGRHVARGGAVGPRAAVASGPPLIVAAPDYDLGRAMERGPDGPFAPLPGTIAEARAITPHLEAYAKAAPRILLGAEARESAVLDPPAPRVLVASTHGYYGGLPDAAVAINSGLLRCGLAFAGANARQPIGDRPGRDGVATGLEILAADFRGTDLVVLSACETSYGEFQTSQGLIGLNLAFHLAGARTVLGALWPVPVDETTELTTGFFTELARGTPGDEALRRSQVKLIKRLQAEDGNADPSLWAGFLLSGEALPGHPR